MEYGVSLNNNLCSLALGSAHLRKWVRLLVPTSKDWLLAKTGFSRKSPSPEDSGCVQGCFVAGVLGQVSLGPRSAGGLALCFHTGEPA